MRSLLFASARCLVSAYAPRSEVPRSDSPSPCALAAAEHCGRRAEGGRQTLLVSATLTPKVLLHCQPWCPDPCKVFVGTAASGLVAAADDITERQTSAVTSVLSSSSANSNNSLGGGPGSGSAAVGALGAKPSWGWGRPGATSVGPAVDAPSVAGATGVGRRQWHH